MPDDFLGVWLRYARQSYRFCHKQQGISNETRGLESVMPNTRTDEPAPYARFIPLRNVETRRCAVKAELFEDLPLLLAVPRAAQILGVSRASAYRLVKSGELPTRRLGGRVYVVTASLRELCVA